MHVDPAANEERVEAKRPSPGYTRQGLPGLLKPLDDLFARAYETIIFTTVAMRAGQ